MLDCFQTRQILQSWPNATSATRTLVTMAAPVIWRDSGGSTASARMVTMARTVRRKLTRVLATLVTMGVLVPSSTHMADSGNVCL